MVIYADWRLFIVFNLFNKRNQGNLCSYFQLALYVLSFLDPRDLLRAAQTCKYWRILADDNLLWREKCKEAGIGYFSAMTNRVHRRNRNNINAHTSNASNLDVPNTRWKAAFMKQHYVEMNWKRKDTRDHKVLKGHDDHVITCLQFSGSRYVKPNNHVYLLHAYIFILLNCSQ